MFKERKFPTATVESKTVGLKPVILENLRVSLECVVDGGGLSGARGTSELTHFVIDLFKSDRFLQLRPGFQMRVRPDPLFLRGTGSGYQISLDTDQVCKKYPNNCSWNMKRRKSETLLHVSETFLQVVV